MLIALLALSLAAPPEVPVDGVAAAADADGATNSEDASLAADVVPGTVVSDPAGDDVVIPQTPPAPPPRAAAAARLIYAPGAFAADCPDADAVRALVEHHLGYDPFAEPAERILLLALDGDSGEGGGGAKRARVELLDRSLQPLGSRVVESAAGCAELVATGALQMSIALDPLAVNVSPPSTTPAPPEAPPPPTPPTPPTATDPSGPTAPPLPTGPAASTTTTATPGPATPPPPTVSIMGLDNVGLFVGVGVHVAALLSPEGLMPGLTIGGGGRWEFVSARVEGRFDITDDRGTSSYPLLLTASPCLHLPLLSVDGDGDIEVSGCATVTAGIMPAFGVYSGLGLYAGGGMRVGLDWHIPGELTLRTFGQLETAGIRPTLSTSTGTTYESPGFNMMFGAGFDLPEGTIW